MKLCLGVAEVAYVAHGGKTTYDVAKILESKYEILGTFYNTYQNEIAKALENSLALELQQVLAGVKTQGLNPFAVAMTEITDSMRLFLSLEEMNGRAGIPTKAALMGKRTRYKKQKERKSRRRRALPPRPSFIDSGMYQRSLRAWVETA